MSTKIDNEPWVADASAISASHLAGELKSSGATEEIVSSPQPQAPGLSFRTFLVAALFLVVVSIGGYLFGRKTLTTERHHPVLEVAPESLDFGKVDATTDFPWKLRVTNVSSRAIQVADIQTSCGCTRVTPTNFEMESGETRDIDLHLNLVSTTSLDAQEFGSSFEVNIAPILTGATLAQPYWTLRGRIVAPCLLDTNKIVFAGDDALVEGAQTPSKKLLAILAHADLKVTARPAYPGDVVDVTPRGDRQVEITIRPATDRPQGWFSSPVELRVTGPHDKPRGTVELLIQGEIIPPFRITPRHLTLGALPVGAKVRECILVDCRTGTLRDASPITGNHDVKVIACSDDESAAVIEFVVKETGVHEDSVHLIYESTEGHISTTTVPISYYGYRPKVELPSSEEQ